MRVFWPILFSLIAVRSAADRLELKPRTQTVNEGERPRLIVRVINDTGAAERFIDVRNNRRRDLRDNYYRVEVLGKGGRRVDVPIAISDPGPISDQDYFVVMPAGSLTSMCRSVRSFSLRCARESTPHSSLTIILTIQKAIARRLSHHQQQSSSSESDRADPPPNSG